MPDSITDRTVYDEYREQTEAAHQVEIATLKEWHTAALLETESRIAQVSAERDEIRSKVEDFVNRSNAAIKALQAERDEMNQRISLMKPLTEHTASAEQRLDLRRIELIGGIASLQAQLAEIESMRKI